MDELQMLADEIASLHDKRHIEQKEKCEQLRTEICQLKRRLMTADDHQTTLIGGGNSFSTSNTFSGRHSTFDYEQWAAMDDESKRLQDLIQSQRHQINELITLISHEDAVPSSLNISNDTIDAVVAASEEVAAAQGSLQQQQPQPTASSGSTTLLAKIRQLVAKRNQQEPVVTSTTTQLDNTHSPGTSPTQSLTALLTKEIDESTVDQTSIDEKQQEQIHETVKNVVPPLITEPKKCPVCNHIFDNTVDDYQMYNHVENCLFPPITPTGGAAAAAVVAAPVIPKDFECPQCNRKLPGDDEKAYLQHLTDCFNRDLNL